VRLLPYLQHSFWFLPNVGCLRRDGEPAGGEAERVLARLQGPRRRRVPARVGLDALPPVRAAIGDGHDTKTITLSCGKLTTGVTVRSGPRS
jgi:hypothetical protein